MSRYPLPSSFLKPCGSGDSVKRLETVLILKSKEEIQIGAVIPDLIRDLLAMRFLTKIKNEQTNFRIVH